MGEFSKVIFFELENETRGRVFSIHHAPYDADNGLTEEQISRGIEVDAIPEQENIPNKIPILYVNPQTRELWYEYIDRPITQEEELRKKIDLIQQALDDLILNGGDL